MEMCHTVPADALQVVRLHEGEGRVLADVRHGRVAFQDPFLHLKARHVGLVGLHIVRMDSVVFQKGPNAAAEGVAADLGNIGYVVA